MSPSNSKTMVLPSGETSSDSHVPSSVVNSILRAGFSGIPFFSSFFPSFASDFSCARALCGFAHAAPPRITVNATIHAARPRTQSCFAFMLFPPSFSYVAPTNELRDGLAADTRPAGLPDITGRLDANSPKAFFRKPTSHCGGCYLDSAVQANKSWLGIPVKPAAIPWHRRATAHLVIVRSPLLHLSCRQAEVFSARYAVSPRRSFFCSVRAR